MSEVQQAKFEGWAIVEMMGHRKEIGFVTTEAYGTAVMFRVDTPELQEREITLTRPEWVEGHGTLPAGSKVKREAVPARTVLVAPSSLYAMNPCNEGAAREAIERVTPRTMALIERGAVAQIESSKPEQDDNDDEDYADFEEQN